MLLKLKINDGNLLRNTSVFNLIIYWILLCSWTVLGRPTDYNYRRRYSTPKFTSASGNVTYFVGATANLSCVIENLGARRIIWRKLPEESPITIGETLFLQDTRISISHDSSRDNWDLLIKKLKLEDTGVYECQVSSSNKNLRQHIFLHVKEPPFEEKTEPPPVISIAGPKHTQVGDTVVIKCNATYIGVASIDWFFDGYLLESNTVNGIRIKDRFSSVSKTVHSTLEIRKVDMGNSGTYTCRSADKYVKEFRVTVLSDVKTNNKKRDFLDSESSTSSQKYNTSTRVSISYQVAFFIVVTCSILLHML